MVQFSGGRSTLSEEPQQDATIEFGTIELGLLSVSDLRTLGVLTDPEAVEAAVSDVVTAAEEAAAAAEDLKQELGGDPVVSEKMILSVLVIALIGALIVLGFLAGLKFYGRRESEVKFDKEIEALVLILVLASILLFGVSGLMTAQGIVAVLSLIAGFALGRQTSS